MTAMKNYIDIKREIPLFDDPREAEIDEVFSSVAWDLPGRQKLPRRKRPYSREL